jgi:hypothetical protein
MSFKCKIGLHNWNGCKCSECGKKRDEQHDWTRDCEKCTICGKTKESQHDWKGCICSKCGKTRDEQHDWKGCICSKCGKTRDEQHDLRDDCEKCSKCGKIIDKKHNWHKDCEKCSICSKMRHDKHKWKDWTCTKCGKTHNEKKHEWEDAFCAVCNQFQHPEVYKEILKYLQQFKFPEKFRNNFFDSYKDISHFSWPNKPGSYRYDCCDLREFEVCLTKSILMFFAISIQEILNDGEKKISNDLIQSAINDITKGTFSAGPDFDLINENHLNESHMKVSRIFNRVNKTEGLSEYLKPNFFITSCELAKYALFVLSTKDNIDEKTLYGIRIPLLGYYINLTDSKNTDGDMMAIECWKSDEIIDPALIAKLQYYKKAFGLT